MIQLSYDELPLEVRKDIDRNKPDWFVGTPIIIQKDNGDWFAIFKLCVVENSGYYDEYKIPEKFYGIIMGIVLKEVGRRIRELQREKADNS